MSDIERITTHEDDSFVYGHDVRKDKKGNVEAVTKWCRWKGRKHEPMNLSDEERLFAQRLATLMINDGLALAAEFEVELHELLSPEYMQFMGEVLFVAELIEKKHFKDITRRWLFGEKSLYDLLKDPRYAKADDSLVDSAVESVYNEHGHKYDGTEKIFNWLVGQVMKATQGKAQAAAVREKLKARLETT